MKILIPIKRVIDFNAKIRVKPDNSGIETANVKMSMNPFDEIAVEEAVKLKEAGKAKEIVVTSIGSEQTQETLRSALAIGADRAIQIRHDQDLEPLLIAQLLHALVEKEQPHLIIMGKQTIDGDNNQTGQMLAALLGWGQATYASKLMIENEQSILVTREIDGGLETLKVNLPAIVTTDLRLNIPRYATLPNIMQAKRKPFEIILASSLAVDLTPRTEILKIVPPPARKPGQILTSAAELVDKLINVEKVI